MAPPARLWVFSTAMALVGTPYRALRTRARQLASSSTPRVPGTGWSWTPESTGAAAASYQRMWLSSLARTSVPGGAARRRQIWLPMVPEGTYRAASWPRRSATAASSRWIVGSSPQTSSPTSASAMARRISGVGRVCVSE